MGSVVTVCINILQPSSGKQRSRFQGDLQWPCQPRDIVINQLIGTARTFCRPPRLSQLESHFGSFCVLTGKAYPPPRGVIRACVGFDNPTLNQDARLWLASGQGWRKAHGGDLGASVTVVTAPLQGTGVPYPPNSKPVVSGASKLYWWTEK